MIMWLYHFRMMNEESNSVMEIGYITRKNTMLSKMGVLYVERFEKIFEY